MKSISAIYKIGKGPSSSHTMGPEKASAIFLQEHPEATAFRVTLLGSLSKTGRGHGTDTVICEVLGKERTEIVWDNDTQELPHPNTMVLEALKDGQVTGTMRAMSIGGGDISIEGRPDITLPEVYRENSFSEIAQICKSRNIRIYEYVLENEGEEILTYMNRVWQTMQEAINRGLSTSGTLPGGLNVEKKAQYLYNQRHMDESAMTRENRIVCAYAFAVGEQNADCGTIVTAPTCGACAVLPSVLKYMQQARGFSDEDILKALMTAGLVGNIVKQNASISGAECGCQAEIGTACSMAAAGLAELFGMGIDQIEYAAEVALEHHLGLTCDPICGLVQIPCIERNAVAAMRAINALSLANFLSETRKIPFDTVVQTMYETGKDLSVLYRETGEGGLAKIYRV
ncbi:MAG: L-serine ammonia-lyase, iron-sulfur-dependent, subunit alpha [Clostridia bacterium]|nr:L-serine ammonia-lyase, iron-sulfur-dependent, subunit alpha [Clostridia bacterium]